MQQSGQESPISRSEPDLLAVQLPFEDRDLVSQGQDFRVLGPVAHGQQPQHRQRVGHAEVRQSQQHSKVSSPTRRRPSNAARNADRDGDVVVMIKPDATRADDIVGIRSTAAMVSRTRSSPLSVGPSVRSGGAKLPAATGFDASERRTAGRRTARPSTDPARRRARRTPDPTPGRALSAGRLRAGDEDRHHASIVMLSPGTRAGTGGRAGRAATPPGSCPARRSRTRGVPTKRGRDPSYAGRHC